MRPRFYWGFRFTRHGLRPYAGVRMGGYTPGGRSKQTYHKAVAVYTCTDCGAINQPNAKLCNRCGGKFSGHINRP